MREVSSYWLCVSNASVCTIVAFLRRVSLAGGLFSFQGAAQGVSEVSLVFSLIIRYCITKRKNSTVRQTVRKGKRLMQELHADVLGFGEIGGVGEMIYHTVRFPEYALETDGGVQILWPRCSPGCEPTKNTDYSLTGQKLLASLCNLFKKINDPSCEESYINLIINWCKENTHPYSIDDLYDMLSADDFDISQFGFLVEKDGIFEINEFIRDLSYVYHTFTFYYAINKLRCGNDLFARNLYYEGRFYDGYFFFEKYKVRLLDGEENGPDEVSYEDNSVRSFAENPLDDYQYLQNTLMSLFPEFRMKLKVNPRTKRIVYAADVQSVFDICWYTLSRMVADDAPPLDYDSYSEASEGSILSCLCCGDFFIRKSSTQKYCENPDCKAERNRRKSKASYMRKNNENSKNFISCC